MRLDIFLRTAILVTIVALVCIGSNGCTSEVRLKSDPHEIKIDSKPMRLDVHFYRHGKVRKYRQGEQTGEN